MQTTLCQFGWHRFFFFSPCSMLKFSLALLMSGQTYVYVQLYIQHVPEMCLFNNSNMLYTLNLHNFKLDVIPSNIYTTEIVFCRLWMCGKYGAEECLMQSDDHKVNEALRRRRDIKSTLYVLIYADIWPILILSMSMWHENGYQFKDYIYIFWSCHRIYICTYNC